MDKLSRNFHFYFLISLLASVFLFAKIFNFYTRKHYPEITNTLDERLMQVLPKDWYSVNIISPEEAKKNMYMWARSIQEDRGLALNIFKNKALFERQFPGYWNSSSDSKLWKDYFLRDFKTAGWMMFDETNGAHTFYSWTGCFEIFKKYGADILVFGSSDTSSSVSVSYLNHLLKEPLKILQCGVNNMDFYTLDIGIDELIRAQKKVKWVIWGFNFANAYLAPLSKTSKEEIRQKDLETENNELKNSSLLREFNLKDLFPILSWDHVFASSFQKIRNANALKGMQVTPRGRVVVPFQSINNDQDIKNLFHKNEYPRADLEGMSEKNCNMSEASQRVDKALIALSKISEKILIYVPPSPLQEATVVPKCYMKNLRSLLESKRSQNVKVLVEDLSDSDVKYRDFIFESPFKDYSLLDIGHMNFNGAKKITKKIAETVEAHY